MKVRAIDQSHDWTFGNNQSDYLDASAAIKQRVLTSVLSVRNDWFLNLAHGIDWINYMGRAANLALLEEDLKSAILKVDGVYRINNIVIDLQREKRKATISIEYTDIYNRKLVVNADVRN